MSGDDSSDYYYYNWMKNVCDQVSGGALGQYRFVESLLDLDLGFGNMVSLWRQVKPELTMSKPVPCSAIISPVSLTHQYLLDCCGLESFVNQSF